MSIPPRLTAIAPADAEPAMKAGINPATPTTSQPRGTMPVTQVIIRSIVREGPR